MSVDLLDTTISALVLFGAYLLARHWMDRWADLRITIFRPYRGDPWPQGVQEEDGVRWRWTGKVVAPATEGKGGPFMSDAEVIPVGRVGSIDIHRPTRR
jgi:hypothetical protein